MKNNHPQQMVITKFNLFYSICFYAVIKLASVSIYALWQGLGCFPDICFVAVMAGCVINYISGGVWTFRSFKILSGPLYFFDLADIILHDKHFGRLHGLVFLYAVPSAIYIFTREYILKLTSYQLCASYTSMLSWSIKSN